MTLRAVSGSVKRAGRRVALAWQGLPPRRPARLAVMAAAHPVMSGLLGGFYFAGTFALGIRRVYLPVVIWGLISGLIMGLVAVRSRKRMRRYGFLPDKDED